MAGRQVPRDDGRAVWIALHPSALLHERPRDPARVATWIESMRPAGAAFGGRAA